MYSGFLEKRSPYKRTIPFESTTDLYRAKHGFPLDEYGIERFIATKAPYRKNKDYRARYRNYSFGYPTYKKDNYTRHWYNFMDIIVNTEAPLLRYTKVYLASFIAGFGWNWWISYPDNSFEFDPETNQLMRQKVITTNNYIQNVPFTETLKEVYNSHKGNSFKFAVFFTTFQIIYDRFRARDYSNSQSALRATGIMAPIYIFFAYDRPFCTFWYRAGILWLTSYAFIYNFVSTRYPMLTRTNSSVSEKFYQKSVSPQEKLKIEYEDFIENYGKMFENRHNKNFYERDYTPEGQTYFPEKN